MKVKIKHVWGVFLIFMFIFGTAQLFMPVTEGQQGGLIVDRSYWLRLANNAWKYYQPGVGVDSTTGLHASALGYSLFTDWDLGVYIQAIIDSNQLGIIGTSGTWGADSRLNKILSFLETRQLASNGLPYQWYQTTSGNPSGTVLQNAADSGELLVALNNLRVFRPDLAGTVNDIVFNRTNYAPLEQAVDALTNSKNLYDYYVASGFAGFWPNRFSTLASSILSNIVSAPIVSTYGVALPTSKLTCEPLLLSVFNLAPNAKLNGLADLVYSAHEAKYNVTGKFAAFSEGNTGLDNPTYVYEWVVKENGSTWTIENTNNDKAGITPIMYFKSAVGLLAMHDTLFTENMVSYIENHLPNPSSSYSEGIDENGRIVTPNIDKTNGMIIEAALYAINNLQTPNPTTTSTTTPAPSSSTSTPTPTPPGNPTASPTPLPTSPTPSSSSSAGPSLADQLSQWYVIVFIAVLIILGFARFALSIFGFLKEQLSKFFGLSRFCLRSFRVQLSHLTNISFGSFKNS